MRIANDIELWQNDVEKWKILVTLSFSELMRAGIFLSSRSFVLILIFMVDEDDKKLIGACGIFCGDCGIYQSYKSQDRQRQERIAKDIFGENADVKPEQIACDGCRGAMDVHWSGNAK